MLVVVGLAAWVLFPRTGVAQREHPITEVIRAPSGGISARPGERFTITLAVDIPNAGKTWHLYSITQGPGGPIRTHIKIGPAESFRLAGTIKGTEPDIANDPNFGIMTETYTDSAIFSIPVSSTAAATGTKRLIVSMYYQTCNDKYCLPPVEDTLGVDVNLVGTPVAASISAAPTAVAPSASATGSAPPPTTAARAVTESTQPVFPTTTLPGNGSLGLFLWIAATMGALSLLTPCVFPMVPITISYFSRGESRGRARAVRDAGVYAVGIVAAFTSLGLGLAVVLGATGLNRFAANPWLNLAIAALFAGFALSLFGVVDLAVPGAILTRIDRATRESRFGRDGTTLLMGATFALTSFTCTAPFVGTLLVSATQGNWKWPALGLLMFSAVFALPFLILALVPEALGRLPRSGEWMVTMKGALAFVELAAAMKFLSNADLVEGWGVVTRNVVLVSWVILGLGLLAYLLGVRLGRTGFSRGKSHPGPAMITGLTVAWLASGLAGKRLGELEPFLPPAGANATGVANANELAWILNDYPGALARARTEHKLVLIDFTGYTCTNCRWMEANMFPRDEVRRELDRFVRVRLFTDGRDESNVRQQAFEEQQFKTVALPLYAVVRPDGATRATYLGMTRNADEFVRFLAGARGKK
jgi:thiol:disulfide interchange protein DsbD